MNALVEDLIRRGVLTTPAIIAAFVAIDRAYFVPTDTTLPYANKPLSIGYGQTISQPETVAFMLELLSPRPGETILDIGSGSGWQTALLSHIVSHDEEGEMLSSDVVGHVVGIERIPELAKEGIAHIGRYSFIKKGIAEIHCRDATGGFPARAPYNRIIAAASGASIPDAWKKELKVGGKIVAPIGEAIVVLTKKDEKSFREEAHNGFLFVPFISDEAL